MIYLTKTHTRIVEHSFASQMQGARLIFYKESIKKISLEIQGFHSVSSKLFQKQGKIYERVRGNYVPLQLTFENVTKLKRSKFFNELEKYSIDESSRTIAYMLSWIQPKKTSAFYMFGLRGPAYADMQFFAKSVTVDTLKKKPIPFDIERDWSPAPPMPQGLVPQPKSLHQTFGGDPITIYLNKIPHQKRLFIGGVNIQPKYRPKVDAVLNLGEEPSRWMKKVKLLNPNDRVTQYGEGSQGMTVNQLIEEAKWVIERLKQNQKVLVHCVAGMNRSVTTCCAILILLEGLTAEQALSRVREHHPWARPDSYHWITLRWLAKTKGIK